MRTGLGPLLRIVGPAIEVVCIAGLYASRGRDIRLLGVPIEGFFYAGIVAGLVLVLTGIVLTYRRVGRQDSRRSD